MAPSIEFPKEVSIEELKQKLHANDFARFEKRNGQIVSIDLKDSGVTDLAPLAGMPLQLLMLENLNITDLTPLKGMELEELYLEGSKVTNFEPLKNVAVSKLHLNNTLIEDISGLNLDAVNTLWIPHTKVKSIVPLKGHQLESFDCENTPVDDLSPLIGMHTLQRLNIANTAVTDLKPLGDLKLQRLIFTPEKITSGIEMVRNMPSLRSIGETFDTVTTPEVFWKYWDQKMQQKATTPSNEPAPTK